MPRNGSGDYERAVPAYVGGEIAEADGAEGVNTEMNDVAAALTGSLARNGEAPFTGDQDADGFTIGSLRASASAGEAVRHEQLTALSDIYQPLDATTTAFSGVTFAAGEILRATGPDTFTVDPTTTYGRSLLNVADEAALKALINAEAGVDFQAYSALLASVAGSAPSAGDVWYATSATAVAKQAATAFGRALWDTANLAAYVTALGGASAVRTALGLAIGSDVQAYDADTTKNDVANTFTDNQTISSATAALFLNETDQTTNQKLWRMSCISGALTFATRTDADGTGATAFRALRTGTTVDEFEINATDIDINGNADVSGTLTSNSDRRIKTEIEDLSAAAAVALVRGLRPRSFRKRGVPLLGFIAQEVREVEPRFVVEEAVRPDEPPEVEGPPLLSIVSGAEWAAPIVAALQEIFNRLDALEQRR